MYRIIYIAKNGKSYDVSFYGPCKLRGYEDKKGVLYDIDDEKFAYDIRTVRWSTDWGVDEETTNKLLLRITFQKTRELLDEGKEENCEVTISRDNFPGKWPPSFIDYPKICSYRIETEEGLFCKAAAPYDTTDGATKWKICEYDCKVPEDFERCEWLIIQTLGSKAENDIRVGSRNKIGEDCEIRPDFDSLKDCEGCEKCQPCVIKSDITGESLELARKLLKLGYVKPAGGVAGNVLEAHLKSLCDNALPPIEYTEADTIFPLADKLREADLISPVAWRELQKIGTVRNMCDHPKRKPPKPEEVADMMEAVGKFIGSPRPP